jgi:hypothetical protein
VCAGKRALSARFRLSDSNRDARGEDEEGKKLGGNKKRVWLMFCKNFFGHNFRLGSKVRTI